LAETIYQIGFTGSYTESEQGVATTNVKARDYQEQKANQNHQQKKYLTG
jgi:hypothetical protein